MASFSDTTSSPFLTQSQDEDPRRRGLTRRRLILGVGFALLLHVLLFLLSRLIYLPRSAAPPLELLSLDEKSLKEMKEQILRQNKILPPLLEQEVHEQYRSKTPPKNAKFIGKFNQSVPEETMAGAQSNAPQVAQSPQAKDAAQQKRAQPKTQNRSSRERPLNKNLSLSDLGFKNMKFASAPPQPAQEEQEAGQRGPQQDFRPTGRDMPGMKRGQDNLLNAMESEYYSFFSRFEEPLIRNWYFFSRSGELRIRQELAALGSNVGDELPCTISFTIDRAGNFLSIDLIQTSKIPTFDQAALMATRKLGSLRNPPAGIFEGKDRFTYQMTFTLVVSPGMNVGAPAISWP